MSRDDIIQMGVEAGLPAFVYPNLINEIDWARMEHFVSLVYAKAHQHGLDDFETTVLPIAISAEREACAKVCEVLRPFGPELALQKATAEDCAAAIRARGQA